MLITSGRLESHNSGDIVILNREPVGNPQSCHKGCKILIAKFHQRANIMQCYVQSTLFYLTQSKNWSTLSLSVARVAEVVRGHGELPPKNLDSDENFEPEHTLLCRKLRFVSIYALFGDL